MRRPLIVAALAVLLVPAIARAQLIRGQVMESGTRQPLYGSIIVLLDSSGAQVAGAITDEQGRFTLPAPAPGRYSLRANRIGFRSIRSATFTLAAGQTLEQTLVPSAIPIQLAAIQVTGKERCTTRPEEGQAAFAVWDGVRTALTATRLTVQQRLLSVRIRRFERDVDPSGGRVTREQSWEQHGVSLSPFVAVSLDTLNRIGYAILSDSTNWYYAPDANVLLSDGFSQHHCFRVQRSASQPHLIGLAFEPVRGRKVPEVQGVLWLDQATGELRKMEFFYVKLPKVIERGHFGGDLQFRRLPTGAWIVQRWTLHLPLLSAVSHQAVVPGASAPARDTVISGIHETGGEVLSVSAVRGGTVFALTDSAVLSGTVFDSTRGVPLAGALVALAGTAHATRTDATGAFRLAVLDAGTYTVAVSHPRLDSLALPPLARPASLRRGISSITQLGVPSLASIIRSACRDSSKTPSAGLVAGTVRDGDSGRPVANAQVTVSWTAWRVDMGGRRVHGTGSAVVATSDSLGHYRACGVPADTRLTVIARAGARRSAPASVQPRGGGGMVLRDVRLTVEAPD